MEIEFVADMEFAVENKNIALNLNGCWKICHTER